MPTYEYACKDCGQHLEVVQAFTDDALTVCPHCGGALKKVFGSVGIVFKGSGFYKTDSRGSSTRPAEPKASDTKTSDAPSSESSKPSESTTSTPASKSESKSDSKSDSSPSKSGKNDKNDKSGSSAPAAAAS
jgi:putative FmdB family regulatory protein